MSKCFSEVKKQTPIYSFAQIVCVLIATTFIVSGVGKVATQEPIYIWLGILEICMGVVSVFCWSAIWAACCLGVFCGFAWIHVRGGYTQQCDCFGVFHLSPEIVFYIVVGNIILLISEMLLVLFQARITHKVTFFVVFLSSACVANIVFTIKQNREIDGCDLLRDYTKRTILRACDTSGENGCSTVLFASGDLSCLNCVRKIRQVGMLRHLGGWKIVVVDSRDQRTLCALFHEFPISVEQMDLSKIESMPKCKTPLFFQFVNGRIVACDFF